VSETTIQKRVSSGLKEKTQYVVAVGVIASMLFVAGFPVFVVFFFGIFGFFLFKMFSAGSRNEVREIFEFYLTANEMLRDDERRWFGFEYREAIERGEAILLRFSNAPPLVHFALGALYGKVGDHKVAVKHLSAVVENQSSDEKAFIYPTPELRSYVKILRKIEREPADAPLTSAAVRSLERARRLRASILLEEHRKAFAGALPTLVETVSLEPGERETAVSMISDDSPEALLSRHEMADRSVSYGLKGKSSKNSDNEKTDIHADPYSNRKPITEVLHDIYDSKVN
jgi:hypothetical protein